MHDVTCLRINAVVDFGTCRHWLTAHTHTTHHALRNFWRSCRPTWTPSVRIWPEDATTETTGTASGCSASGPRTWPRPCCGPPTRTSEWCPRTAMTARTRTTRTSTTTTTTTATDAGGLPGGSGWRPACSGGWCRRPAVGCGPRSGKEDGYTPVDRIRGRLTTPGTGLTLCWYVPVYDYELCIYIYMLRTGAFF